MSVKQEWSCIEAYDEDMKASAEKIRKAFMIEVRAALEKEWPCDMRFSDGFGTTCDKAEMIGEINKPRLPMLKERWCPNCRARRAVLDGLEGK